MRARRPRIKGPVRLTVTYRDGSHEVRDCPSHLSADRYIEGYMADAVWPEIREWEVAQCTSATAARK